jgi:tRNA(His) 5'-end guanylyltransferase
MANTRYAYVRNYEQADGLLPNMFLVVRLDEKSFHGFSENQRFQKPNDRRALELMDAAARSVGITRKKETRLAHALLQSGHAEDCRGGDKFDWLSARATK